MDTHYKLDPDLKFTWMARGKRKLQPMPFSCHNPFNTMNIDPKGRIFVCDCDGVLPWPVANILDIDKLEEVWTSPIAKKLQENTKLGTTFKFCDTINCGIKQNKKLPRYWISLGIDDSCNLRCPSCREHMIFHKKGSDEYNVKLKWINHFAKMLSNFDKPALVNIGAHGDAFASPLLSDFVYNYGARPEHKFRLQTNGLLISRLKVRKSSVIKNLESMYVSIDASCKSVYEIMRPPGRWENLLENLDYLNTLDIKKIFTFVVQKENIHDCVNFVKLCEQYNALPIFTKLQNWGTWHNFEEHEILDKDWQIYKQYLLDKGAVLKGW